MVHFCGLLIVRRHRHVLSQVHGSRQRHRSGCGNGHGHRRADQPLGGTVYAIEGRLWLPMVVHATFDITAVALIYWQWESAVAHLLFR